MAWLLLALWAVAFAREARAAGPHAELQASLEGPAEPAAGTRRFALVVGANDGGQERDTLRFAGTDASAVAKVLRDIGGVGRSDVLTVLDPTPDQLRAAFSKMRSQIQSASSAGQRTQFLFYYSGHSDERGLLLGGVVVSYKDLRAMIETVPASVHLGVLDSCASGAFTRLKGGKRRAPFLVEGGEVEGHAFLTSSSADEAAQESDRVGGSFFTHYLVTGLRGAADSNNDKQVTLNEAYRFAFDETLARTELSEGGPQHAAYAIRLTGTGDLVMTDLRATTAKLEIAKDVGGRLYVRDAGGRLVAELFKPAGSGAVVLALEPGAYRITLDDGSTLSQTQATISDGAPATVAAGDFAPVTREQTTQRGAVASATAGGPQSSAPGSQLLQPVEVPEAGEVVNPYRVIPFDLGLVPSLSLNAAEKHKKVINHGSLSLGWSRNAQTHGIALAMGATVSTEEVRGLQQAIGYAQTRHLRGVQAAMGANVATGRVHGVQAAMGLNLSQGPSQGVQAAFGLNLARQEHVGLQFGSVSWAESLRGVQFGLINVSRGRVRGLQLGLINYADEADASIGLLPMTKKGGVAGEVWASDTAIANLGLRLRAKYTYGFLAAGVQPFGIGRAMQAGGGFGGRIPLGKEKRGFIDIDLAGYALWSGFEFRNPQTLAKLRVTGGARLGKRFELWGGVTANGLIDWQRDDGNDVRPGFGWVSYTYEEPGLHLRAWPGFVVGVRY